MVVQFLGVVGAFRLWAALLVVVGYVCGVVSFWELWALLGCGLPFW